MTGELRFHAAKGKEKGLPTFFQLPQQMALLALTYFKISPNQEGRQNREKCPLNL